MSLIGPRPERPYYVEKFKEEIPQYMIKHQVRPGLTGWAQVNGYRGDTSIEKRIEYDLYYIENWTIGLDLKILFLTVFKGFINKKDGKVYIHFHVEYDTAATRKTFPTIPEGSHNSMSSTMNAGVKQ